MKEGSAETLAETQRVAGFHGTSGAAAESILRVGFRPSDNDYDWLGDGAYFFEDGPARAYAWARQLHPDDPAVLRADISLLDCMDLKDSTGWARVLHRAHDQFVDRCRSAGIPLPRQTAGAHRLDRAVINLAAEILEREGFRVRSVRAVFTEGRPAFPGSFLFDESHVQVAVRDLDVIKDIVRLSPDALPSSSGASRELR